MNCKIIFCAMFLGLTVYIVEGNTRVDINLAARDLPSMDPFGEGLPDPFADVYYAATRQSQFFKIGETRHFSNTYDCKWPETFTFFYSSPGSLQRVKVDVMDYDYNSNDEIGFVEFDLSEIIDAQEHRIERNLTGFTNKGTLIIQGRIVEAAQ